MPTYLTPGVYYEAVDRDDRRPVALRTDVAGFAGVAVTGPLDTPVRVASWRQFETVFGGLHPAAFLGHAVKAFFENGGRECHVVRAAAPFAVTAPLPGFVQPADGRASIVAPAGGFVPGAVVTVIQEEADLVETRVIAAIDPLALRITWDAPLSAGLWLDEPIVLEGEGGAATITVEGAVQPRDHASSLVRTVAGFIVGRPVQVRQTARVRRANHRLAAIDAGGAELRWDAPLAPMFRVDRPLRFETGAAPASDLFTNSAGTPAIEVAAASPGAWGNNLRVRLAVSAGAATRTTTATQPADRTSSLVGDVSGFQRGDLIRAVQTGARPEASYLVVAGVDAGRGRLIWRLPNDPDLPIAAPIPASVDIGRPFTIEQVDLSLSVYAAGQLRQMFPALSLVPIHPRYAPLVLAADPAALIRVTDVRTTPQTTAAELALFSIGRWLAGGRDGLAALTAGDLIGVDGDPPTGLAALGRVDEVAILAAPDAHLRPGPEPAYAPLPPCLIDPCLPCEAPEPVAPPPPPDPVEHPPSFTDEDVFRVQAALVEQCERLRDRFAVVEPPLPSRGQMLQEAVAGVRAWRKRFDTKFAALYFPWPLLRDPLRRGSLRAVPPCGHVAGLYARFDLAEGVHRPPANGELHWVQTAVVAVEDALHGVLNPEGINAIRAFPGRGIRVYGARTLSSDPLWRYVNVRRLMSMVEESIEEAMQWSVFEPNNLQLRELLRLGIGEFLEAVWRQGALVGEQPEEAFFVKCDDVNNPPALADVGQLVVDVGVAPAVPGEFIVVRVGRTRDELRVTEIGPADRPLSLAGRV